MRDPYKLDEEINMGKEARQSLWRPIPEYRRGSRKIKAA